jgi:hypothetical protein
MLRSGWACSGRFCGSWNILNDILSESMTKVTLHYDLTRPLGDQDFDNIAQVHATYGMARVQVAPSLDKIIVDYDASRLMKKDVEAVLANHGIPIRIAAAV